MNLTLTRVNYSDLNSRQKENYNFHKLSAVLVDFGFTPMRLSDDWNGADFIAPHIDGKTILRVQLKGRLTFKKKYRDQDLWIAFPDEDEWYLYPHNKLLEQIFASTDLIRDTSSWQQKGGYSFPSISKKLATFLSPFKINGSTEAGPIPADCEDETNEGQ